MVKELIRDTAFGHLVRLITGKRVFQYPEESDPKFLKHLCDNKKTGAAGEEAISRAMSRVSTAASDTRRPSNARTGSGRMPSRRSTGADGTFNKETTPQADAGLIRDSVPHEEVEESKETAPSDASSERTDLGDEAPALQATRSAGYVDPEKGRDLNIIEWDGDNDPGNPRNWSPGKKYFVTFQIIFLTFSVYIGSAIYTPGLPDIMRIFGVSEVAGTLGLTLYVAGYGLGPLLWSPMSEVPQVGRLWVYIATLFVFVFFNFGVVYAKNFGMLLAFRFLTGFFGSPALATGGASIADMYAPRKQAYGIAFWGIGAVCGPTLGPLIGGFAAENKGWTWTIWELIWLSGTCWVFLFLCLPETSSTNILYRRTQRLKKLSGDPKLTCVPELAAAEFTGKDIVMMMLVKPITLNFYEPIVFLLNLYIALVYGLFYIWFESFPLVFEGIYHFNTGTLGLAFLGLMIGVLVSMVGILAWVYFILEKEFDENGNLEPERRLPPAMVGCWFVPICLFWFGWSSRESIHWIMPIIGTSFFGVAAFSLFQAVLPYLCDAYPDSVASVLAGNDLMRSSFGAGFPLFARAMYVNLGIGWASSTLAFLGIAFIPIPFALYKYGKQIRRRSKNARQS